MEAITCPLRAVLRAYYVRVTCPLRARNRLWSFLVVVVLTVTNEKKAVTNANLTVIHARLNPTDHLRR